MWNLICGAKSFIFWIIFFFVILLILWLFYGGGNHEFIGLKPITEMPQIPEATYTPCEMRGVCMPPPMEDKKIESLNNVNSDNNRTSAPTQGNQILSNDPKNIHKISYLPNAPNNLSNSKNQMPITKKPNNTNDPKNIANPINLRVSHVIPDDYVQPYNGGRSSKGEKACKQALEDIFGVPFNKVRPKWLKNPETGRSLEIDCYNDDLKIGLEYNSAYHYTYPNAFNKSLNDFIKTVRRDKLKLDLCDQHGVYLITVKDNIRPDKIKEYILSIIPPELLLKKAKVN